MDERQTRERLLARRRELRARSARVSADLRRESTPLSADWIDRATDLANDEVLEEIGQSAEAELRELEAALARLEQGEYGICGKCGQAIAPERLEAVAYADRCHACASPEIEQVRAG